MRYLAALVLALTLTPSQVTADPKGTVTLGTPIITPAPKPAGEGSDIKACRAVARLTFLSCGAGYAETGGNRDKESQEFKDGVGICNRAANVAGEACMGDGLEAYVGRTQKGDCSDLAVFQSDSIIRGCQLYTKDEKQQKKCERWAEVGTGKFAQWCEQKQKQQQKDSADTTDL